MRVNHAGELAAQALYHGQAFVTRSTATRDMLMAAARSESDHLAWCETRLKELAARPSLLNPLWYAGSFAIGAAAALMGDRASLGFVAETERQVEGHLDDHSADSRRATLAAVRYLRHEGGRDRAWRGGRGCRRRPSARTGVRPHAAHGPCHDGHCLLGLILKLVYLPGAAMEENIKPLSEIPAINRFLSYCRIRAVPPKPSSSTPATCRTSSTTSSAVRWK